MTSRGRDLSLVSQRSPVPHRKRLYIGQLDSLRPLLLKMVFEPKLVKLNKTVF